MGLAGGTGGLRGLHAHNANQALTVALAVLAAPATPPPLPDIESPLPKETSDLDRSPAAVAKRLHNSPESVENRVMLATLRESAARYKAAKAKSSEAPAPKISEMEPVSKKTYDLANSPESVENRGMLAMFASRRARKETAAKAASHTQPLPEIDAPPIAP